VPFGNKVIFVDIARLRSWNPERNAQVWNNRVFKSLPTHLVFTDLFNWYSHFTLIRVFARNLS